MNVLQGGTRSISIGVQSKRPLLVVGSPGVGKTSFAYQLARSLDAHIEVVIASLRQPTDFAGLPVVDMRELFSPLAEALTKRSARERRIATRRPRKVMYIEHAAPSWARRLNESKRGLLILDEISTAPPSTQAALLRVLFEKTVGELYLGDHVGILAIANPADQAAGGWELTPPLANRLCHLDWHLDNETWINGMIAGFRPPQIEVLPADWERHIPRHQSLVASFIRTQPGLLNNMPKAKTERGRAWPSPRTWQMASHMMAACYSLEEGIHSNITASLMAGCVGEGATTQFLSFMEHMDLPDPESLLKDPHSLKAMERGDQQYAVADAVVSAVINKMTLERWKQGWKVLARMAEIGQPDMAAAAANTLAPHRPDDWPAPAEIGIFVDFLKRVRRI